MTVNSVAFGSLTARAAKNYQFLSQKLKEKSPGLKQGKAYEINENQRVFNYNHKGKTINLQKNPL